MRALWSSGARRRAARLALLAAAALPGPAAGQATAPAARALPEGTRRMAQRLAELDASRNPARDSYATRQRVEYFRQIAQQVQDPLLRARATLFYGLELLNIGRPQEAIAVFEQVRQMAEPLADRLRPDYREMLDELHALAWLRLGELENCIGQHSVDSCLLPIRGSGVHALPRGSRGAIEMYTRLLEQNPDDLRYRWLLNLAYMTLGEFPDRVPPRWRIPAEAFESDYPLPRFYDRAVAAGVAVFGQAGGSCLEDFDRDGDLDIFCSSWDLRDPMRLLRNDADGGFTDISDAAGLTGLTGGLNLVHADYDNDGWTDVLALRGAWLGSEGRHPNSLLRNRGDGTFEDVTEAAGLGSAMPTQTAVWADFDNDGWLDLFIGNESYGPVRFPCELYRNNRDGTFTECAAAAGVQFYGFVKGVTAGDYDNDGRPDLYISCLEGDNVLYRNDGPAPGGWVRFTDVTAQAGVAAPYRSFPVWFWDYDNDGWEDLFVAGYFIRDVGDVAAEYLGLPHGAEHPRLYRNNGDGTFTDVSRPAGLDIVTLPMGANFGDLDNDGWLDLYLGTGDPSIRSIMPNRMLRNDGGRRFQDVTTAGGFGHLQKGHGISFGDVDNDGDQDIYAVMGGAYPGDAAFNVLFENPGNPNAWVVLRLEGTRTNRSAIGARVRVVTDGPSGRRVIHRTVGTGGSFGCNSLQLEIGLGDAQRIVRVEIDWPVSGQRQVLADVPLRRFLHIREGDDAPRLLTPRRFVLRREPSADGDGVGHHHPHSAGG